MNDILAQQQKHYQFLRSAIKDIEGVTFRHVPEGGVENYSFLNIFLPTVALAEQVHAAMTQSGIDACFYWFKNNWHYISGWPHLTQAKSLYPMMPIVQERLNKLATQDFSKSDHYMGRNVSFLIKLGWDEETLKHRAALMTRLLEQVLSN